MDGVPAFVRLGCPIRMMTEDDERYPRLPLSGSFYFAHFPGCVRSPAPPFRAISARFQVPLFPNDRLWA